MSSPPHSHPTLPCSPAVLQPVVCSFSPLLDGLSPDQSLNSSSAVTTGHNEQTENRPSAQQKVQTCPERERKQKESHQTELDEASLDRGPRVLAEEVSPDQQHVQITSEGSARREQAGPARAHSDCSDVQWCHLTSSAWQDKRYVRPISCAGSSQFLKIWFNPLLTILWNI